MTDNQKPIPLFRRVVVTKRRTYELELHQTGSPAADVFGAANAERYGLTDATVYDMPDGRRVIARPESSIALDRDQRHGRPGSEPEETKVVPLSTPESEAAGIEGNI